MSRGSENMGSLRLASVNSRSVKCSLKELALQCGLLVFIVLQAACNSPGEQISYPSIEARQADLRAFDVWRANGRIALSTPQEGFSAALDWQQAARNFDVTLTAILGQRALHVSQMGADASLSARGRPTTNGNDAELLILRELGVRVPLQQLGYWMRGLPGESGQPGYDPSGRLQSLEYTDVEGTTWIASFNRYQRVGNLELPQLIDVQGNDYKIRLSLKEWSQNNVDLSLRQPPAQPQQTNRLSIPGA